MVVMLPNQVEHMGQEIRIKISIMMEQDNQLKLPWELMVWEPFKQTEQ
jgi:hypothetical protein